MPGFFVFQKGSFAGLSGRVVASAHWVLAALLVAVIPKRQPIGALRYDVPPADIERVRRFMESCQGKVESSAFEQSRTFRF